MNSSMASGPATSMIATPSRTSCPAIRASRGISCATFAARFIIHSGAKSDHEPGTSAELECSGALTDIGEQHPRKQINYEDHMNKLKIPHNAYVFVGDGRKALFLRNDGDEKFPNLKTEKVIEEENPSSHEQCTERPGHIGKGSQRSAVEPTDWHDI